MNPNQKVIANQGEFFSDLERYRKLVRKLINLTIPRLHLPFAVGVSQFVQTPYIDHWNVVIYINFGEPK